MAAQDTQVNLILQNWKPTKNGNFPVVVKVYHNRKRRYFRTGVSVHPKHWDEASSQIIGKARENKLVQKLLHKALELAQKIETLHDEFDFDLFSKDFSESSPLQSGENFVTFWESVIRDLRKENRNGTADSYENALNKFKKFVGSKSIPIRHITQLTFEKFRIFMVQSGQSTNGIGIYLRSMSAVYGRAIKRKLVKPESDPRDGFKIKTAKTPKKAIKQEEMRLLASLDLSNNPFVEESRDLFLFSYYCQGMNFKDMCLLRWDKNIVGDRILYARKKTLDFFNIKIRPGADGKILEKQYRILNEMLEAGQIRNELSKKLVFRIFDDLSDEEMKNPDLLTKVRKQRAKVINAHIRKLAATHLKYEPSQVRLLSFYSARHTYATVLLKLNAPIALISEALGHADTRTTQVYLNSFSSEEIDRANEGL
ncbi:site-specific integrase [Algoriphagus aestuariicola]|uniref:Site-specific integrase n=1 Tax=Algoriphagus aestuariicola TaxID=1852016 RepID=A0ABS3BJ04_9BACT|nr:site-specific integrase [Algoriphagus aestuariicola]MBN7799241.1 site-specific integrase [Algoriphagus aestuariicola]